MKQIVQTDPKSVELENGERPSPGPEEVLVRVHSAGLCGSDAHAYLYEEGYEWIPIPRIMGHEYSGTVAEVGENVASYEPGDRVVEEPIHHCGECFQCLNGQPNVCQNFSITGMHRDGAYADYTVVDPEHLHSIPDTIPLRHAAITEPTSIAARAVLTRAEITPGERILVQGPGPIGTLVAAIADSMGAEVLVSGLEQDTDYRLPMIDDLDIETVNAELDDLSGRVAEFTDGLQLDAIFDTTGHHSGLETALDLVRKGGRIVVVGLPAKPSEVYMTPLVRGEVDVQTSYGSTWTNFEQAIRLLEREAFDVGSIIDTGYSIDAPEEAFEAFLDSRTCKPVFAFDT